MLCNLYNINLIKKRAVQAPEEDIKMFHSEDYVSFMKNYGDLNDEEKIKPKCKYIYAYLNNNKLHLV